MNSVRAAALVAAPSAAAVAPAAAQMAKERSWTARDTGSSGFTIAVAVGAPFRSGRRADMRIAPSGDDAGRLGPVRANRAVIARRAGIDVAFE